MHFLSPSTALKVVCPSTPYTSATVSFLARPGCHAIRTCNKRRNLSTSAPGNVEEEPKKDDGKARWEKLGLRKPLVEGLSRAYPNVVYPTRAQEIFIPAILSGGDVLLKDETGTGKSFGIALALLGKPRVKYVGKNLSGTTEEQESVTSLVLVPHSNLAYQYMHWIRRVAEASTTTEGVELDMERIAQYLTRDGQKHLSSGMKKLHETKPHILVSTPQAMLDLFKLDPGLVPLQYVRTVVVDEVDYLVETVPRKDPGKSWRGSYEKAIKKIQKHPGATRELLDFIYVARKEINRQQQEDWQRNGGRYDKGTYLGVRDIPGPQLVLSSATLRMHLSNYLYEESGWLDRRSLLKVKNTGSRPPKRGAEETEEEEARIREAAKVGRVKHCVIEVSDTDIRNVEGAVEVDEEVLDTSSTETRETSSTATGDRLDTKISDAFVERYQNTPSPFNPNALEAIATAVALVVPKLALLVVPSVTPVFRAVYELREMGLDAQVFDAQKSPVGGGEENPVLLVTTLAMSRGLDLPDATHIFSLGIPDGPHLSGRTVDAYLHVSGRVGRFGRRGTVVTVVEKASEGGAVGDGERMKRILKEIGAAPVRFRPFE
ncbi:hypothetical protein Agabi119p4_758 [Agaricus bisporus var. burnettii]|uniref:ATP-dependent RNA helicase n=1 Tax=Agaricus bisporus var. burnettii TaxID=192524 RepID=A0A8H7FBM2_AGABI|nr:hypothetical protein Agabi119p4_758 [Agaricus bisporus var. burnettii]